MKKKVCFSIVSHDQSILVDRLLKDIDKNISINNYNLKVVITDNVNDFRWTPTLNNHELKKINNLRQKGFGANHNAVFENFEADFFFVINPDVRIEKSILFDRVINQMSDLIIYSPKVINENGILEDYKRRELTIMNLILRRLGLSEAGKSFWFAGIFHGYTYETFRRLDGFDTKYFMYVEDADICYRVYQLGGKIEEFKNFTVVHNAQRQSLKKIKNLRWHLKSLLRFYLKKMEF